MAADQPEVALDKAVTSGGIGPEPGLVSAGAARNTLHGVVGLAGVCLGAGGGLFDERLLGRRAAHVANPLVMGAGDSEVSRKLNLGKILNGGIQVLEGAVSVDVGEHVRWLDGVVSSARLSKVVRGRD